MDTIADRIKMALQIRQMKQKDLVRATGIGKSSISTYLAGLYEPKQKNIYKIARALRVNEAWLMGYDVDMELPLRQAPSDCLTPEETRIALAYRAASTDDREAARAVLRKYMEPLAPTVQDAVSENAEDV